MRTRDSRVGGIALHSGHFPTNKLHLVAPEYSAGTPYHPSTPQPSKWVLIQVRCLDEVGRLIKLMRKLANMLQAAVRLASKASLSTRPSLWEGKERKEERETEAKTGGSLVPQLSSSFCSIK